LNGSIKPPGGENGRDGEASSFLAEGGTAIFMVQYFLVTAICAEKQYSGN
jgi:hypothetical protein